MWYSRILILLGAVAMLSACGGGSGGGGAAVIPTKNTPAPQVSGLNGIWDGSYTSTVTGKTCNDLQALILNGKVRAVSKSCDMVLVGNLTVNGNTASISFNSFSVSGSIANGTGSFTGNFTVASVMTGTYSTSDKDSGNFTLNYNIIYENNSSLSKVEGSWEYNSGSDWVTLGIDNAGAISGADNVGCAYSGSISPIDPAYNLYTYNITLKNLILNTKVVFICPNTGKYTGVSSITTAGANETMTVLAGNDQKIFFADFGKASGATN